MGKGLMGVLAAGALLGMVVAGVGVPAPSGGVAFAAETTSPAQRMVGLPFETIVRDAAKLPGVARQLDRVRANGVSITVGRTDWTAFPWPGHREAWSGDVQDTGRDYVAEALQRVRTSSGGQRRDVVLVVDCLVDGWIARDPSVAGVDAAGRRSTEFPSMTALESGPVGDRIVELVGASATRYRADAVSLTELFADTFTFGAGDLASYRRHTGRADWPRTASGAIATGDASIGRWRSEVVAGLVARARTAARAAGAELHMEVRVNWSSPSRDRPESGHDYDLLLAAADKLVFWDYFGLSDRGPGYTERLAAAAQARAPGRVVMSIGLWADAGIISPWQMVRASEASVAGGVTAIWVTPASLMTDAHWNALARAWAA